MKTSPTHPYFTALAARAGDGHIREALQREDVDGAALRAVIYLLRLCVLMNEQFRKLAIDECTELLEKLLSLTPLESGYEAPESSSEDWESNAQTRQDLRADCTLSTFTVGSALRQPICPKSAKALQALIRHLEKAALKVNDGFSENLAVISRTFGLSQAESAVLGFAYCRNGNEELASALNGVKPHVRIARLLAPLLGLRTGEVTATLAPDARLRYLGLLGPVPRGRNSDMEDATIPTDPLQTLFSRRLDSSDDVSNTLLTLIQPSTTSLDFSFLGAEGHLVRDLIRGAVRRKDRGINILIHGRPGTGKTEFVRSLVRELGIPGFSVPAGDDAGREASRNDRLAAYQLTQRLASSDIGCFVFLDEAEDIFPEEDFGFGSRKRSGSQSKAWVNQLLEENIWPTVWVSNRIRQIDPAYLRRFRLVMPFPGLDKAARTTMVDSVLGELDPGPLVRRTLCEQSGTTPGVVTTLRSVLQTTEASGETAHRYANLALRRYADALNLDFPLSSRRERFAYDPAWLNWKSAVPAAQLTARIRQSKPMTLLLHGRPGTGKTAFGEYLCRETGRTLVYRTASDLLSKWLGESEQNIRDLFLAADTEKSVVFLDECDSLLGARESAGHRWEISLVNEFLRGIERFEGVFIAATNHVVDLDPALMRRFHAKVELLPMRPLECVALVESVIEGPLSPIGHAHLLSMQAVTLGDVHNALQFLPRPCPETAILEALCEELRYRKDRQTPGIGFSAAIGR